MLVICFIHVVASKGAVCLTAEYPATRINFCVAGYAVRSEGNL